MNEGAFMNTWVFDPAVLDAYGLQAARAVLERPTWAAVIGMQEPTYRELTKEFLATVVANKDSTGPITFRLLNVLREMTIDDINRAFGCETGGHMGMGMNVDDFWESIAEPGADRFASGKATESSIRRNYIKVLH